MSAETIYKLAWKKLKEAVSTEKTSWGRNELLTRMAAIIEEVINDG